MLPFLCCDIFSFFAFAFAHIRYIQCVGNCCTFVLNSNSFFSLVTFHHRPNVWFNLIYTLPYPFSILWFGQRWVIRFTLMKNAYTRKSHTSFQVRYMIATELIEVTQSKQHGIDLVFRTYQHHWLNEFPIEQRNFIRNHSIQMLGIHCGLCVGFRASLAESLTNVYTCVLEAHTCYAVSLEMPLPLFQLNIFYVPYHVLYVQHSQCVYTYRAMSCHTMQCKMYTATSLNRIAMFLTLREGG